MTEKDKWIDYKEIKSKVSMETVLDHYGLLGSLKKSGKNLVGCCPIHKGANPKQFSVSLEKNIFNCFGDCGGGGNVLDFVSKMEEVSIRDAALLISEWSLIDVSSRDHDKKEVREREETEVKTEKVNPPLTFSLKNINPEHSFFSERGISKETVEYFGLGYCSKGMMKGWIAIPVHDEKGNLIAYCGRAVSKEQIETEGKYKMPPKFVKSAAVYNLNRQKGADEIILVESFLSVFWIHQAGYPNVVALMGSSLSERQEELIVEKLGPQGRAILMFDADESGRGCEADCLTKLSRRLFVRAIDITPFGKKPHHLKPQEIRNLI